MTYEEKAKDLFFQGYSCAQSVFCAFCDITGMDIDTAARISSSFGAGMGRLREVCGAVSGMFMVAGMLYGYDDIEDPQLKKDHYARIQELAIQYEEENGSIICRELLGLKEHRSDPTPEPRTQKYYQTRPCADKVASAARIMEQYIKMHPIMEQRSADDAQV